MRNVCTIALLLAFGSSVCGCRHAWRAEDVLPVLDGRFWDLQVGEKKRAHWSYLFLRDGTCIRYVVNRDATVSLYDGGDIFLSHRWFLRNDTLSVDDLLFRVRAVGPDTVTLQLVKSHAPVKLVKTRRNRAARSTAR
jgi:hypothetical protein